MFIANTDSVVDNIYYYLWLKDDCTKIDTINIAVPNTIIFKNGKPQFWYFWSKNKGILIKK